MLFVKHSSELIDVWVEDRFPYQTQSTMPYSHRFCKPFGSYTRDASHHLNLLVVACFDTLEDHIRRVNDPAPRCANWIGTVSPAENAFVGAGERWCSFHALVRGDAIE